MPNGHVGHGNVLLEAHWAWKSAVPFGVGHGNLLSKRRFDCRNRAEIDAQRFSSSRNRCPTRSKQHKSMPNGRVGHGNLLLEAHWAWKSAVLLVLGMEICCQNADLTAEIDAQRFSSSRNRCPTRSKQHKSMPNSRVGHGNLLSAGFGLPKRHTAEGHWYAVWVVADPTQRRGMGRFWIGWVQVGIKGLGDGRKPRPRAVVRGSPWCRSG